jgi:hypothetical protein
MEWMVQIFVVFLPLLQALQQPNHLLSQPFQSFLPTCSMEFSAALNISFILCPHAITMKNDSNISAVSEVRGRVGIGLIVIFLEGRLFLPAAKV